MNRLNFLKISKITRKNREILEFSKKKKHISWGKHLKEKIIKNEYFNDMFTRLSFIENCYLHVLILSLNVITK